MKLNIELWYFDVTLVSYDVMKLPMVTVWRHIHKNNDIKQSIMTFEHYIHANDDILLQLWRSDIIQP